MDANRNFYIECMTYDIHHVRYFIKNAELENRTPIDKLYKL